MRPHMSQSIWTPFRITLSSLVAFLMGVESAAAQVIVVNPNTNRPSVPALGINPSYTVTVSPGQGVVLPRVSDSAFIVPNPIFVPGFGYGFVPGVGIGPGVVAPQTFFPAPGFGGGLYRPGFNAPGYIYGRGYYNAYPPPANAYVLPTAPLPSINPGLIPNQPPFNGAIHRAIQGRSVHGPITVIGN
ncbi:hypothetical protein Isop_1910 [Isosphaera pallida ATCC 43644]|uniref:Uncharacterized protein n=1 Tax=Isosphaera pallida (strain ATCC 43644 / DSM 9630 / IS1B) TaxID=575540 RepID=E8R2J0_ISOPI|nr:hypothetical protein [Isosphaera pallida]ADV62490.1 hypothetical protein Isop_1910 [Isosphaera pallida ATCC 43644]